MVSTIPQSPTVPAPFTQGSPYTPHFAINITHEILTKIVPNNQIYHCNFASLF